MVPDVFQTKMHTRTKHCLQWTSEEKNRDRCQLLRSTGRIWYCALICHLATIKSLKHIYFRNEVIVAPGWSNEACVKPNLTRWAHPDHVGLQFFTE